MFLLKFLEISISYLAIRPHVLSCVATLEAVARSDVCPMALRQPVGRATRESHTAITSYNFYEVRIVATYNIVLSPLFVGPDRGT